MMKKFELNIDWDLFKAKFIGRETSKFEQMAYLLFAYEIWGTERSGRWIYW